MDKKSGMVLYFDAAVDDEDEDDGVHPHHK
jgi:hypothetical protein